MLSLVDPCRRGASRLTRRAWLRAGSLTGLAALASLARPLSAAGSTARGIPGFGRAKSVLLVFASGGQSQIDIAQFLHISIGDLAGAIFEILAKLISHNLQLDRLDKLAQLGLKLAGDPP